MNYGEEYGPTVVEPQRPFRPTETMDQGQGPIQSDTSYALSFTGQQGERVQPIRHERPRQEPDKFDATATYQDDFRTWSLPERPRRTEPLWLPPQQGFQGSSTSHDTFTAHAPTARDPNFKPDQSYFLSQDPFPNGTEVRDNFVEHPTQPLRLHQRNDPRRTPPPKFDATTTSGDTYRGVTQPKREPFRPAHEVFLPTEPLDSETTFRRDYQPWVVGRRQRREAERYDGPQGDMDFHTTSKGAYTGSQGEPRVQAARRPSAHLLDGSGPMDTTTNYSSDFGEWKVAAREAPKPRPGYEPSTDKFRDETTNRTDFRAHEVSPRQSQKPDNKVVQSTDPFPTSTGYRETFVPHPFEPKSQLDRPSYSQPAVPMATSTTSRDDFRGVTAPKRSSKRPDRKAVESTDPFVSDTTSKTDFRAWPLGEKWRRQQDKYAGPQGDMDLHTTTQVEFRPFQVDKVTGKKPESAHLLDRTGPMETTSHYGTDFGQWKTAVRDPLPPKQGYEPPADKFDATSTTHSEFKAHNTPRMQIRRPDKKPFQSEAPFEGTSGYSQEFIRHPVEVRKPRQRESHVGPRDPFKADTTFSADFTAKYQPKRESCKPVSQAQASEEPFDAHTTNKDSYKWTKVEARPRPEPARWERPEGAMELTTVTQSEFPPHANVRRNDYIRPRSSKLLKHEGKVEGTSNYATSFQRWDPAERARPKERAAYEPNQQPFEGQSTSKSEFVPHLNVQRAKPKRPDQNYQPQEGAFEGNTTYGTDFQDRSVPAWLRTTPKATPIHTVS